MRLTYDEAFDRVIGHEGAYQNDHNDRGNWTTGEIGKGELKGTKWGISAMSYPHLDIEALTQQEAKEIYYNDFWLRVGGDDLPAAIVFQLFDAAINHGVGNAIRMLQRAVDVADDGQYGPVTESAVMMRMVDDVLHCFNAERLDFYTKLSTWHMYGKGWVRRVTQNMRYGAYDYTAPWYVQMEAEK